MALKPCRVCQRDVAEGAETCPHCGTAVPTSTPSREWAPCPKCGSAETGRVSLGGAALAMFLGAGCLMWIPIVGWVLAPLLFVGALLAALGSLLPSGKLMFACRGCRQKFTIPKKALPA